MGSLGEIIVEGVNGYTVPYGDLNKMADLLVNLFNDQRRLRAMWSSAFLESLKYDWEKTAEIVPRVHRTTGVYQVNLPCDRRSQQFSMNLKIYITAVMGL